MPQLPERIPKPFRMMPHSAEMALYMFECYLMDRKIPYTRKTDDPMMLEVYNMRVDHIQVLKFSLNGLDYIVSADIEKNENFVMIFRDRVSMTDLVYRFDEIFYVRMPDERIVQVAQSKDSPVFLWPLEDWLTKELNND